MILQSLALENFRNYEKLEIDFSPGINHVVGENGQGKTNLLEAIYCLGLVRSFRASRDQELIRYQANNFRVEGQFRSSTGVRHQTVLFYSRGRRALLRDGKKISRHSELIGSTPMVLFSPEDHRITSGSPSERRRLIDVMLSQSDKRYLHLLQRYQKLLKQRNALLTDIADGHTAPEQLDVWDVAFAETGAGLAAMRQTFLNGIAADLSAQYHEISAQRGNLQAAYLREGNFDNGQEAFLDHLHRVRKQEVARRSTLSGPHRDDIQFTLDDRDVRRHASRGEQKSVLLALKIIEFKYLKEKTGINPILLLDDIYSELDTSRQENLLAQVCQLGQTFITTTTHIAPPATEHASLQVSNGSVEKPILTFHEVTCRRF